MNSIGTSCFDMKQSYDGCFNKWFAEVYLKGEAKEDVPCKELFTSYQACVKVTFSVLFEGGGSADRYLGNTQELFTSYQACVKVREHYRL